MKKLEKHDYFKVIEPLSRVTINNLFARAIVELRINGDIFVDDTDNPKTFLVAHPYGMSLLFGDNKNKIFNADLYKYSLNINKIRNKTEWLQAFPGIWNATLDDLFKDCCIKSADNVERTVKNKIELNTRVNFKFNFKKYQTFKEKNTSTNLSIVKTDRKLFEDMKGSVVPSYFWESADDFINNGIGFSLLHENKLAATAHAVYKFENKLELGIETVEEFRGKGYAQYVCAALIDYCLENKYEPIWACRLENTASFKLAQKLGFEPSAYIPFYRLVAKEI